MSQLNIQKEAASGLWRSEDMQLVRLTIQREAGPHTLTKLGKLGIFQLEDLNPDVSAYQRSHTEIIRRCDELIRKLRNVSEDFAKIVGDYQHTATEADPSMEEFQCTAHDIDNVEREVTDFTVRATDAFGRYRALANQRNNLIQYQSVLRAVANENNNPSSPLPRMDNMIPLLSGDNTVAAKTQAGEFRGLQVLTGTIPTTALPTLHRGAWRVTRGNFVIHTRDMTAADGATGDLAGTTVFVAYMASSGSAGFVRKLATAIGASLYDDAMVAAAGGDTNRVLLDLRGEIDNVDAQVRVVLAEVAALGATYDALAKGWEAHVTEERSVAVELNKCAFGANTMTAVGWVPSADHARLVAAMNEASVEVSAAMQPLVAIEPRGKRTPPTYFRTNQFTSNFQQIVDSYGTARYKEVNPGVFTIITFPFLFAVMFGDFGHGALLLVIALLLVGFQRKLAHIENEMFQMIFGGRYLMLLMALFSIYIGILYNDCFSLMVSTPGPTWSWDKSATINVTIPPTATPSYELGDGALVHEYSTATPVPIPSSVRPVAGSVFGGATRSDDAAAHGTPVPLVPGDVIEYNCFHFHHLEGVNMRGIAKQCVAAFPSGVMADPRGYGNSPYWGLDGGWFGASNRLDFTNSFKMKQAVILGVAHMLAGVALGGLNYIHKRDWARLAFMTIPELLFLACTFGWMDVLIISKWLKDWPTTSTAPSLLQEVTSFFLAPGSPPDCYIEPPHRSNGNCTITVDTGNNFLFHGQFIIQVVLLLVAVISIILILFPIICIHCCCSGKKDHAKTKAPTPAPQPAGINMPSAPPNESVQSEAYVAATVELLRSSSTPRESDDMVAADDHDDGESHDTTEIVIHQMIHTIEYVLGCVSNTASYLRLWALSLAHAQLAEVFWQFTFEIALTMEASPIVIGFASVFLYAGWIAVTLGVLVGMEGLSAFLHALRLHWVEFQNKFYAGDGVAFTPFKLAPLPDDSTRFDDVTGAAAA